MYIFTSLNRRIPGLSNPAVNKMSIFCPLSHKSLRSHGNSASKYSYIEWTWAFNSGTYRADYAQLKLNSHSNRFLYFSLRCKHFNLCKFGLNCTGGNLFNGNH